MGLAKKYVAGVGLCVIPKPENDHRPLALRRRPLAFVSGLLLSVKVLALLLVALTPTQAELSTITTARILQLTNAERKKKGLNELTMNSALASAAEQKGKHMLAEDYFAHISPSGVTPWFWMNKTGYRYTIAGENLAIDFTSAENVVAAWMASPTHRDNMLLSDYLETGVAVVTGEFEGGTSTVVVHMFGRGTGALSPLRPTAPAVPATAPTTTPTPSPTVTIVPSPAPPTDTTAPRPPRIAVNEGSDTFQNTVSLTVAAETGTTLTLLINNHVYDRRQVKAAQDTYSLSLTDVADGPFTITAISTDEARNQSPASDPLQLSLPQ